SRRRAAVVVSTTIAVSTLLAGDAVMVAVAALARRLAPGNPGIQWLVAAAVAGVGSFVVCGLPQLKAWEEAQPESRDPRVRFGVRVLNAGGGTGFVMASIVGGPMAVALFARSTPDARRQTVASAVLFGAFWGAV